jgi:hypothetical protein
LIRYTITSKKPVKIMGWFHLVTDNDLPKIGDQGIMQYLKRLAGRITDT